MKKKAFCPFSNFGKNNVKCMMHCHLGRSMIEMLGVLAIIGVLSIGGLYAYRQAMDKYRTNQVSNFIPYAYMAMRDLCTSSSCTLGGATGDSYKNTRLLICSIIGYDKAVCDGGSWGNLYGLSYNDQNAGWLAYVGQPDDFRIKIANVPPATCAEIVSTNLPIYQVAISGLPAVTANGNPLTAAQKETLKAQCHNTAYTYLNGDTPYSQIVLIWKKE